MISAVVYGDTVSSNLSYGFYLACGAGGGGVRIANCRIEDNASVGVCIGSEPLRRGAEPQADSDSVIVEYSVISGNYDGVARTVSGVPTRVYGCSITGNSHYGVLNEQGDMDIDARWNWWGHPTGPSGVGPGLGDAVSEYVLYDPWLTNPTNVAPSTRSDPTAYNNARKVVRDECPPYYKLVYTTEMGVWITMTSDPINGPWTEPIEVWPVDMAHHSTHPAIAIEGPTADKPYSALHLVWSEHIPDENAPGEIYYSYSPDGGFTWYGPVNLSNSPDIPSEHPAIVVDGRGTVHVVWEEYATFAPDIFYVSGSDRMWTIPVNISFNLTLPSVLPTIASNYTYLYGMMPPYLPDDRVHIAWTEFTDTGNGVTPWIAYRSFDPDWGWIPPLDSLPEDATVGTGGAFASIIAYPSPYEVGRAAAVVWQSPFYDEDPPSTPCGIWFNQRTSGAWGTPTPVWVFLPEVTPSWYPSLSIQVDPLEQIIENDTLWCVWEEWDTPSSGRSEIYCAYSPDFGRTWTFYQNLSQTEWDQSRYPSLAFQKGVTFDGLFDVAWTEIMLGETLQAASLVYYLGTTSLKDSIYAGAPHAVQISPVIVTCYPNPALEEVNFAVSATRSSRVLLKIFDVSGRLVRSLPVEHLEPGTRFIRWDLKNERGIRVAPGIYLYELVHSEGSLHGRLVVLR